MIVSVITTIMFYRIMNACNYCWATGTPRTAWILYIYIYNKYIHVNMIQLVVEFLIGYLFAGFLFTGHGELKLTITRIYPQSLTGLKL